MSDKNQMVDTSSHSSDLANSTYKKSRQSSGTENNEKDANSPQNDRGAWDNKLEYLLSSIGYAVGLGNVWRFPYLCFKNGGGAFLLPYLILLALCGLPIFLLENSLGQFSSQGPTRAYNGQPIMKGIGFAMIIVSSMVAPYYNIILSWIMYYIWRTLAAFKEGKLPWVDCEEEYGIRCVTREESAYCKSNLEFMLNSCTEFEKEFKVKRHTAIVNVNTEGHELNTECLKNSEFSTAFNDFFTG